MTKDDVWRASAIFVLFLVFLLALVFVVKADECPPDKPISRRVYGYPDMTITCTAILCLPQLQCPPSGDCTYIAPPDCNKCTEPVALEICMTGEELNDAMRRGR